MKQLLPYIIAGLVIVSGASLYGWYQNRLEAARWQGRVAEMTEQLDVEQAAFADYQIAEAERKDSLRREVERKDNELEAMSIELDHATHVSDSLVTVALRQTRLLPAPMRTTITGAIRATEERAETCSLALQTCYEAIAARDAEIWELDKGLSRRDSLLALQAETIVGLKGLQPKQSLLPWIIAGTAVTLAGMAIIF